MRWENEGNGRFTLYQGDLAVLTAYARASDLAGRTVDTRDARQTSEELTLSRDERCDDIFFSGEDGLMLRETLRASDDRAYARCTLFSADGQEIESNDLVPLIMCAKSDESPYMWRGLQAKILQIPYDNDMWSRYEAVGFRAGRKSADMTVLISEETREGILIGAVEFDIWKNAIACSGFDCRRLSIQLIRMMSRIRSGRSGQPEKRSFISTGDSRISKSIL